MRTKKEGFDEFGNPVGKAFDLGGVDDQRLQGERILLYGPDWVGGWSQVVKAVNERNLNVDVKTAKRRKCLLTDLMLTSYSQLWFISDEVVTLSDEQILLICDYVRAGNGLFLVADNDPLFADANALIRPLIGSYFSGNKTADRIMVPGDELKRGAFIEHPITQGINKLYEGITICTIRPVTGLKILGQSHDGQNCIGCYENGQQRIVLDTGFTKFHDGYFLKTAGTARYLRNIAFWLAKSTRNLEYKVFTPGRESLATINPGGTSERYKHTVNQSTRVSYILHWEGTAALGLVVQDPQGHTLYDSSSTSAPIRFEVTANIPGDWVCWVKAVNVPKANFPYVLTLVVHKGSVADSPSVPQPVSAQVAPRPMTISAAPSQVATKRLPVYIVIDSSAHASDCAPNLDMGIRIFVDRLRARAVNGAAARISMILADEEGQIAAPLMDVESCTLPKLPRRGKCGLKNALKSLLSCLANPSDGKPLVLMILAGRPEDDWTAAAAQLHALASQGKVNVFVISIGNEMDGPNLRKLTPTTPLKLGVTTQVYSQQTFEWLYQIADVILNGMERGSGSGSRAVPAPPACLRVID
jgi:uncharacterized protein YegL